jgi:hypothetical protein
MSFSSGDPHEGPLGLSKMNMKFDLLECADCILASLMDICPIEIKTVQES